MELIDLNKVISDILGDLEVLVQQKEASIHFEKLPSIEAIGVLIYQLLYNLINNSLKFSSPNERPVIGISTNYASVNSSAPPGVYSLIVAFSQFVDFHTHSFLRS